MGRTSSLFLVDEKNNKQFPKLINLLKRKGETFDENVLAVCQVSFTKHKLNAQDLEMNVIFFSFN